MTAEYMTVGLSHRPAYNCPAAAVSSTGRLTRPSSEIGPPFLFGIEDQAQILNLFE